MEDLNRRNLIRAGGVVGAAGAVAALSQTTPWTWSPANSVPGRGRGADPRQLWDDEADPVIAKVIDSGQVRNVNRLLRTWHRNSQPLPAGLLVSCPRGPTRPSWPTRSDSTRSAEPTSASCTASPAA